MRLGLNVGYWGAGNDATNLQLAQEADRLGFAAVWTAEAYGSDAATVLAFFAAQTTNVDLGAAVLQIPARSPAMTAMTAATLDTLSGGRFRLGLGVSGPQVSEGWHGVRFDAPIGRTREYVDIVRLALSRQTVRYDGKHYQLPLASGGPPASEGVAGGGGPGKALHLTVHPVREHIPIYLAAIGPKNLHLTGEIADGWLPVFFAPEHAGEQLAAVEAGAQKAGRTLADIDIAPTVPLVVGEDWQACADRVRGYAALYLGGMGSREKNFYNALACRMGFEQQAREVQEHYLDHDYPAAMEAVPLEFIDATSLLGPVDRIAERLGAYADVGVGTLNVSPLGGDIEEGVAALRAATEAMERAGVA